MPRTITRGSASSSRRPPDAPARPAPPRRRMPRRAILVGLTLAVLLGSLPWIPGLRPADWLARAWRMRWSLLPTSQAVQRVADLPRLGKPGWELLVDALADHRLEVVDAAGRQLQREFASLEGVSAADASRRAAWVMARLRLRAVDLHPSSYPVVKQLAQQILLQQLDDRVVDEVELIQQCEEVLAYIHQHEHESMLAKRSESPEVMAWTDVIEPLDEPHSVAQSAPVQPLRADQLAADDDDERGSSDDGSAEPELEAPEPPLFVRSDAPTLIGDQPDQTLLEMLSSPDAETVLQATSELERRGYDRQTITLAEHLLDPSADVRLAMIQRLPQLPITQLRPWLLRLSRDEDVRVRRAAVSRIATTNDPELRRRLREMEATENDPIILRRIEQSWSE